MQSTTNVTILAVGSEDALVILDARSRRALQRPRVESAVCDVQFDPLSTTYMLLATRGGVMQLLEVDTGAVVR